MPLVELDTPAAEGPEAKPIFTPPPMAPAPSPITAPSTVEAAAARVQEYGGSLSEAEMRAVLTEAGWPVELHDAALRVAWCESRWSPHGDNGVDKGLFQLSFASNATLRGSWYAYFGVEESRWADPVTNATVALWIHQRSGWGPWSCKP